MKRALRALPLVIAGAVLGCGGESGVVRVYDGHVVQGNYVPPEAYAAYLRGVLAEEAGDLRGALAAYDEASREDDEDPEPLVKMASMLCRLEPNGKRADDAFERALRIDRTYAGALAAQARCATARGRPADGRAIVERIAPSDRKSAEIGALLVRLEAQGAGADRAARERAIALTLASGQNPVAWDALIAWGRGKADGELLARGLEGLLRVAPTRRSEVEAGALELLGIGHAGLARRVAAAVADAPTHLGVTGVRDATVARLAIDEAIFRGDLERAERRAIRGRVALSEVAARALLLERPELAALVARRVLDADPNAGCASMVLVALGERAAAKDVPTDQPAAACVLAVADRLATVAGPDPARQWVARVTSGSTFTAIPHDPATAPLAVDLAARGVIATSALPLALRLELAARRRERPPAFDAAALEQQGIDPKHALLWHLLVDPGGAPAKTMLARLAGAAERDPIIGFALARATLASPARPDPGSAGWGPVLRAIAAAPAHPLLLAIAVEVAQSGGRAEEVTPARARLMAVARTPAERALATE